MSEAPRDQNHVPTALGVSSASATTTLPFKIDSVTGRLLTDNAGGGSGTVQTISIASANGFAGTSDGDPTNPILTLSTTVTGIVKGNGTALSAASAGTDYVAPGAVTSSGLTMATAKLLGRSTAGTGAIEEISIGTGLSLSAGTLSTTGGSGDVVGPASATDNAVARFDGTTGKLIQNSAVTIADTTGDITAGKYNGLTISASTGTLTIANGKTLTASNSITLAGTDGKTLTLSNSGTLSGGDGFTLSIAANKTLTVSNTLTFTGTDASSVAFGAGGTVLYTTSTIPLTVGTTTIASGTTTRILYDNAGVLGEYTLTGSGTVVAMQTAPTFVTSIQVPLVIGGTGTTGTQLTFKTTTGNGTTDQMVFVGGNNGATTFATLKANSLDLGTSAVLGTGTIELGAASDTTLSRSAAGVLAVEGVVIPSISSTNTLTNKRVTRRLTTTNAPGATPTTNTDNVDVMNFTGLGTAITSMTTNLSGTPSDGDLLEFRFTDDGTARAITWGTSFASTTVTLPTTTVISTMLRVGFEWNSTASKWQCIAVA